MIKLGVNIDHVATLRQVRGTIYPCPLDVALIAESAGADAAGGLGMLVHQGVKSFEIWTGMTPSAEVMRAAVKKAMAECWN